MQIKPQFKAKKIKEGWQVRWLFSNGEEQPIENGIIYPQRQNAYRRAKQLNDANMPPYQIHVRFMAQRQDCKEIKNWIEKNLGEYGVFVLDPLWDHKPETRYIQFSAQVRSSAENRDPEQASFDEPLPVEQDFIKQVENITKMPVDDLEISHHSFRP